MKNALLLSLLTFFCSGVSEDTSATLSIVVSTCCKRTQHIRCWMPTEERFEELAIIWTYLILDTNKNITLDQITADPHTNNYLNSTLAQATKIMFKTYNTLATRPFGMEHVLLYKIECMCTYKYLSGEAIHTAKFIPSVCTDREHEFENMHLTIKTPNFPDRALFVSIPNDAFISPGAYSINTIHIDTELEKIDFNYHFNNKTQINLTKLDDTHSGGMDRSIKVACFTNLDDMLAYQIIMLMLKKQTGNTRPLYIMYIQQQFSRTPDMHQITFTFYNGYITWFNPLYLLQMLDEL